MQRKTLVIANSDPAQSVLLAGGLREHVEKVLTAASSDELRNAVKKHRPAIVIADLETVSLSYVAQLRRELEAVHVVCTHRVPDEQMWSACLGAGASDCCAGSDVEDIIRAALCRPYRMRAHAA